MRLVNYILLGLIAIVVIALSLANRHVVTVYTSPDLSAYGVPATPDYQIPLFVVALLCGTVGFILGALREYLREGRHRRAASQRGREIGKLQREMETLRGSQQRDEDDEIIALTSR